MAVEKRGNSYRASFMINGVRYRETFDTTEQAEDWETEVRRAVKLGKKIPDAPNQRTPTGGRISTVHQLLDHVWEVHWKQQVRSAKATKLRIDQLKDFFDSDMLVRDMKRIKIDEYVDHCLKKGNGTSTINRRLSPLSFALKRAVEMEIIEKKPVVPHFKEAPGRIRFLSEIEEEVLLRTLNSFGMEDVARYSIVATDTGFRKGEMLGLKWIDIREDLGSATVWLNKADLPRTTPLTSRAKDALQQMKDLYPDQKGPFTHMSKDSLLSDKFDRAVEHIGWEDVTIHVLRHTCGSRLAQRGVDLRRIKEWLGHKRIETTMRYAHLAPSHLVDVLDALERSSPPIAAQ